MLEFLTAGQTLESVYAALAEGRDSLASLFAAAASKLIASVETLDDLDDDEFEVMETGRPPGYCAQTLLKFGGLNVTALLDTGATCSAVPEVAVATIG